MIIKNKVRTSICKTGGLFHLLQLQAGLMKAIREIKPDWVVYTGIDTYYVFDRTIKKTIEIADAEGYNMVSIQHFNFYNTGEERKGKLWEDYFFARKGNLRYMIAKYNQPFSFEADSIIIKNKKIFKADGILINYGDCKSYDERFDTFRRRKKAWDAGLDRNYGVHYIEGHKRNWLWNKSEMIDIRKTEYYKYIEKIKL